MSYLSLRDIYLEYGDIVNELEENGGELTPELEERLAVNRSDLQEQLERLMSLEDAFNTEHDRLFMIAKQIESKANSYAKAAAKIKAIMKEAVVSFGKLNVTNKGNKTFAVELKNGFKLTAVNSPVLQVLDEERIPQEFKKFKYVINTNFKGGEVVNQHIELLKQLAEAEPEIKLDKCEANVEVDKTKLKNHIKSVNADDVDYAQLVDNYNVRIS